MKRYLVMTVLAVSMFSGCHKVTVKNAPPGVNATEVSAWYQATGAVKIWGTTSKQLTDVAVSLKDEFPSSDSYQATLEALGKEDQFGLEATHFLQTVPQNFDAGAQGKLAGLVDQGIAALDNASQVGVLQIKNPTTKATVSATLTSLRASLKILFALSKPNTPIPASIKGD